MVLKWERQDAYAISLDPELIPQNPGIYLWKICPKPFDLGFTKEAYLNRVEFLGRVTQGVLPPAALNHSVFVEGIALRGRGLSQDNAKVLEQFLSKEQNRKWFRDYLATLENHLPAVYCGETGNLRTRVGQHLRGETVFGLSIEDDLELSWGDLAFYYCTMGVPDKDLSTQPEGKPNRVRQSIEHLTSILTISPRVRRPG